MNEYLFSYRGGEMSVKVRAQSEDQANATLVSITETGHSIGLPGGHIVMAELWYTHADMWELVDVIEHKDAYPELPKPVVFLSCFTTHNVTQYLVNERDEWVNWDWGSERKEQMFNDAVRGIRRERRHLRKAWDYAHWHDPESMRQRIQDENAWLDKIAPLFGLRRSRWLDHLT